MRLSCGGQRQFPLDSEGKQLVAVSGTGVDASCPGMAQMDSVDRGFRCPISLTCFANTVPPICNIILKGEEFATLLY